MSKSAEIKKVRPWHEELMDFMLAQPRAGLKEASDYFGVSMAWLSTVKNSDAFQVEWAKKRKEHSSAVSQTIVERVEALAEVCLETMTTRLEREGQSIGLTTLREVSETALRSLGFGQNSRASGEKAGSGNTTIMNSNVLVVDRETLARAREARSRMQQVPSLDSASHVALEGHVSLGSDQESEDAAPESETVDRVEFSGASEAEYERIVIDNIPPRRPMSETKSEILEMFKEQETKGDG